MKRVPLAEKIAGVCRHIGPAINPTGRPADLDGLNRRCRSQTELKSTVAGREVTSATQALGDLAALGGGDDDACADAVPVRVCSLESKCHEVARVIGLVVEIGKGLVLTHDQKIGAAVVIEIARCQAATETRYFPRRPGLVRNINQSTSGPPLVKSGRHRVGIHRPKVIHVAVGDHDVGPAVVGRIDHSDAESQQVPRGMENPR